LAAILDAYDVWLMDAGVEQLDLAPRNGMLIPGPRDTPSPQPMPRVVLIDYGGTVVYSRAKKEDTRKAWDATKLLGIRWRISGTIRWPTLQKT
jgi:hypothetical protein